MKLFCKGSRIFFVALCCLAFAACGGKKEGGEEPDKTAADISLTPAVKKGDSSGSGDTKGTDRDSGPTESPVPPHSGDTGKSDPESDGFGDFPGSVALPAGTYSDRTMVVGGQEAVIYKNEGSISAYAPDADGNLYTASLVVGEKSRYILCRYDGFQKLADTYELDVYGAQGDISGVDSLAVQGRTAYFTANCVMADGSVKMALYTLDLDTGMAGLLVELPEFDAVVRMLLRDGNFYVLGTKKYSVPAYQPTGRDGYTFYGERLLSYRLSDGKTEEIGIEYPISMAFAEDGRLMVHAYEDGAYGLLEYDPADGSIQMAARFPGYVLNDFAVCHNGKDIIYSYTDKFRGLVLAPLDAMDDETELCPEEFVGWPFGTAVHYQDGDVYLFDINRNIIRFTLSDVYRGNTAIRYISPGYQADEPYGCGYAMERQELSEDKFALKVLAQDSDYDLCLIDSLYSSSYNLRKNGVFYPLNDVPGIKEYLDRCFPYVKEAAIKEDGTVWMLPVAVYMPGFIVQEETLKELGVMLKREMTWEEFGQVAAALTTEQKELVIMTRMVCYMQFFQQYFKRYDSVDQDVFRRNVEALKQLDGNMNFTAYRTDGRYLFYYVRHMDDYTNELFRNLYFGEDAKIYPLPKLAAGDVNTASCIMLAVNPASDRLKETLDFIADYITWQMKVGTLPFFREPVPDKGSFDAEIYALYENGEIAFDVDSDVYMDGVEEMLDGKKEVEEYIRKTDKKLKIYFGE